MKSGSVFPPVETPLLLQAQTAWHFMCQLNVTENELSQHTQIFQSLLQEPLDQICNWWHHPKINLVATRYIKPAQFVSQWTLSACLRKV